uniref:Uncharacterized protein n=1 Tax=Leersia perrieri TaxID=77586 RepID=A0A0D9X426_9ORYZ
MDAIPKKLESILREEARKNAKSFERISGKLFTPKGGGTFLIRLIPSTSSSFDEPVYLLYRWSDLYFESFYTRRRWFRLKDHKEKLPPRSQLLYPENEDGVYILTNTTNYGSIGGKSIVLGPRAWDHCHTTFLKAGDLIRQSNKKSLTSGDSPALAVPQWIINNTVSADLLAPQEFTELFDIWGKLSSVLFSGDLPDELRKTYTLEQIAKMIGILMTGKREVVSQQSSPKKFEERP